MPRTRPAALAVLVLLLVPACGAGGSGGDELAGGESQVLGQADEGIDGVEAVRVADNTHTESPVEYRLRPPAGGAHHPVWWNCGFYDEPVPDEHAVHSLEHGAVWLAYDPALSAADLDTIRSLAPAEGKVLASPYPDLPEGAPLVATAWARRLVLDRVDDERLVAFVEEYVSGSQSPEASAPCSGTPFGDPLP